MNFTAYAISPYTLNWEKDRNHVAKKFSPLQIFSEPGDGKANGRSVIFA